MLLQRIIFSIFMLPGLALFGQERIGVLTDNYMPVNQNWLNPASMVDQKPWISINVVGAHFYGRNNMLHVPDSRLSFSTDLDDPVYEPPARNGKAFVTAELLGPSMTINFKEHAFGLHTAIRSYINLNRLPTVLAQIINDADPDNVPDGVYEVRNSRLKTMSWAEIGLSYGKIIVRRDFTMINAGATVKRLIGIQQAGITIDNASAVVDRARGTFIDMEGEYSFTDAQFGAGSGWGLSTGLTYKKMLHDVNGYLPHSGEGGCKTPDYKYKLGVSLLDIGYLRFKEGARTAVLPDTASIEAVEDIDEEVLGIDKDRFTAFLPAAISVQADYRINEWVYVNATIVQRLSVRNTFGAERANFFSVSPRFESGLLSASLPISLSNYENPQVGLYFRIGPVAIGTDHISPIVFKGDIRAASIYLYLNIPIQNSPICKYKASKNDGRWLCPKFD